MNETVIDSVGETKGLSELVSSKELSMIERGDVVVVAEIGKKMVDFVNKLPDYITITQQKNLAGIVCRIDWFFVMGVGRLGGFKRGQFNEQGRQVGLEIGRAVISKRGDLRQRLIQGLEAEQRGSISEFVVGIFEGMEAEDELSELKRDSQSVTQEMGYFKDWLF